jgi:MFS family permease
VALLGSAQTLAWASSYYLPAMLATPMARDLGVSPPTIFAAFSTALIVSALVGPWAGRAIDRQGGRPVLMGTNLLFASGLLSLGLCQGPPGLFAAWVLIGAAMGSGLYEAAFAALVRLYGHASRDPITGITLIAGFASTVGWPLSTWMEVRFGWRGACFGWAALHLLIGLPLNALLPRARRPAAAAESATESDTESATERTTERTTGTTSTSATVNPSSAVSGEAPLVPSPRESAGVPQAADAAETPRAPRLTAAVLAFVFAVTWFISTAMAAHLPRLLQAAGATLAVAVAAGALIGPAQVAGRLLEYGVLRRVHPLLSARLATLAHPLGAVMLMVAGAPAAALFALMHGAGNGILTIAKGTLPLVLFGPQAYGARQGWLMMPARVAQAVAPFAFGVALDRWGSAVLGLSTGLGLCAFGALMLLPRPPTPRPVPNRR